MEGGFYLCILPFTYVTETTFNRDVYKTLLVKSRELFFQKAFLKMSDWVMNTPLFDPFVSRFSESIFFSLWNAFSQCYELLHEGF